MISFRNDYSEGAHPSVLEALSRSNFETTCGYSMDPISVAEARGHRPCALVRLPGGRTCTSWWAARWPTRSVIAAALRPWEGVIAADDGAHQRPRDGRDRGRPGTRSARSKRLDGKLNAGAGARASCAATATGKDEHMVLPRMVYISDATELGTIYTKGGACRAARGVPGVWAVSVPGRRTPARRAGRGGKRSGSGGFCKVLRCFLHRRHEKRPAVRRSACHHE